MKPKKLKSTLSALSLLLMAGVIVNFYGCSDSVSPKPDNVEFSVISSADTIGDAQNILELDTVKILIRDIKLNVSNNNQDSTNFKVGPYVLFLDLGANVTPVTTALIPPGVYDKIKFYVHKLNNNEPLPDPEFADSEGRYSAIVKGKYMGQQFIYKSSKSAHQILQFPNSITVSEAELSTNITLSVRPYIWFMDDGVYIDPRDPSNSNIIDNNIKDNINNNFKAFRDNDKNGIPD